MTDEQNAINCYTKLVPKWIAIIAMGIAIATFIFIPTHSLAFYLVIGMCAILIVKTLTQKPETNPVIILSEAGIRISDTEFYSYNEIEKVLAFSEKRLRFRSISFKLLLKQDRQAIFCVDNLDVKPQFLLDTINNRIKK